MDENINQPADDVALGGNVRLTGFGDVEEAQMEAAKKLIATYASKIDHYLENLQELALRLKAVHKTEQNEIHNISVRLTANGQTHAAEAEDRNLLTAIDSALTKIENATRN